MQQGDPLGPLLFALGLEGDISEGRTPAETTGSPLDLTAFFHDDGTVGGSHEATHAFHLGFQRTG